MKRQLFFWLEKLKITPSERKVITGLLVLLMILGVLNLAISPSVPFERDQYRALEKQFAERTAMIEAKEEKMMEQYYPLSGNNITAASIDTVIEDSTSSEEEEEPKGKEDSTNQISPKQRINVNTADQKALETLPGIGPTYAKRIIKYRNENGGFKSPEELKKIKGIAQKRLEKLLPFIKLKDSE